MPPTAVKERVTTVTTADGVAFPCGPGDTLLRAALRAGVPAAYECNSGGCGTCKVVVHEGDARALMDDPPGLTARDRRKGTLLACQTVPVGDCVVDLRLDTEAAGDGDGAAGPPRRRRGVVTAARDLNHDIRELTVTTDGPAEFRPGQYVMASVPSQPGTERAYSMANLPNPDGHWQLQVKRVPGGALSPLLTEGCGPGAEVDLDGPYGHAHYRDTGRDVVCIAGGSGLAPMVGVARALARSSTAGERGLVFFYGGRGLADLCAGEFVAEVRPALARAVLVEALSETVPAGWRGRQGFVHEALDHLDDDALGAADVYVAGPPPMTDAVVRHLVLDRQVPADRIFFDRFY